MDKFRARIFAARDIAVEREGDIRIMEFLRAITIRSNGGETKNITLELVCHFRSWQKCVTPNEVVELAEMSENDLAQKIAGWVQQAINEDLLTLSDPPNTGQKEAYSVRAIVTYIYDKNGELVGKKWG